MSCCSESACVGSTGYDAGTGAGLSVVRTVVGAVLISLFGCDEPVEAELPQPTVKSASANMSALSMVLFFIFMFLSDTPAFLPGVHYETCNFCECKILYEIVRFRP